MIPILAEIASVGTVLTYALQPSPSPFTANPYNAHSPYLGDLPRFTLVLLISNEHETPHAFNSVELSIPYGPGSTDLVSDTAALVGVLSASSTDYTLAPPTLDEAEGVVQFSISPSNAVNPSKLQPGESLYLVVSGIITNDQPGVVLITVTEQIAGEEDASSATFPLPVLPIGFYFNNLIATEAPYSMENGVAQVKHGRRVQLSWDTSVVRAPGATFTVLWSTQYGEQSVVLPSESPLAHISSFGPNVWRSHRLTADTVFTVMVTISEQPDDNEVTFALSTTVAVQDPDLVAGTVSAGTATINGTLTASTVAVTHLNADDATVAGTLRGADSGAVDLAGGAVVTGVLTVSGTAAVTGLATFETGATLGNFSTPCSEQLLTVFGGAYFCGQAAIYGGVILGPAGLKPGYLLSVNGKSYLTGAATLAGGATVSGSLSADTLAVSGTSTLSGAATIGHDTLGTTALTARNESADDATIYAFNKVGGPHLAYGSGTYYGMAFFGKVGHPERWGFCTDGRIGSLGGSAHFTQVATQGGPRVATSPLSLGVEVHASGVGKLAGGRAEVAFDDAFADLIVPGGSYRVLATPLGPCGGLHVAAKDARGFRVESGDAGAEVEFDWLVVAPKRRALDSSEPHPMPARIPQANAHGASRDVEGVTTAGGEA